MLTPVVEVTESGEKIGERRLVAFLRPMAKLAAIEARRVWREARRDFSGLFVLGGKI
jgi:hypothetical protein